MNSRTYLGQLLLPVIGWRLVGRGVWQAFFALTRRPKRSLMDDSFSVSNLTKLKDWPCCAVDPCKLLEAGREMKVLDCVTIDGLSIPTFPGYLTITIRIPKNNELNNSPWRTVPSCNKLTRGGSLLSSLSTLLMTPFLSSATVLRFFRQKNWTPTSSMKFFGPRNG